MTSETMTWFLERVGEHLFASFQSWDRFVSTLAMVPRVFVSFSNGLGWPFLLFSLLLAGVLYHVAKRAGRAQGMTFREFAFPATLYRHRSTRLDFRYFAIDLVMTFLFYLPIVTAIGLLGTKLMSSWLSGFVGWEPPKTLSPAEGICAGLGFLLLNDFLIYVAHVWFHRIPWLWTFHRVHHSAEVLTPLAAYRVHPVEVIGTAVVQAPAVGLAAIYYQHIVGPDLQVATIVGVNAIGFLITLIGTHLRHSHIWFSYGPVLNWLLMSPAHHQCHHSVEARHLNKNFGVKLAIWDALFGTLYRPNQPETFRVGLPEGETYRFTSVHQLYLQPFAQSAEMMLAWQHRQRLR